MLANHEDCEFLIGENRVIKNKIALVEDDEIAGELTKDFLVESGFEVDYFTTGADAISNIQQKSYDLLLLDINLPDYDGFEILKYMKSKIALPTIMLSANIQVDYKLQSFMLGAVDYMTKPFDLEELEARIWLALNKSNVMEVDKDTFQVKDGSVFFKSNRLTLTKIEAKLINVLIENKNRIVQRDDLSAKLSSVSSQRSLDYHIKNIRKKIKIYDENIEYLKTEYSVGYILEY